MQRHFLFLSMFKHRLLGLFLCLHFSLVFGQNEPELKWKLNDDGSKYFKFTAVNQVWIRQTQTNPGSAVFGSPVQNVFDIGIRRLRFQAFGQLNERVFFYTQFGINNFTYMQPRFTGAFFHDAVAEYAVSKDILCIGAGLTGWTGPGRYASPAVGTVLSLDVPLYQQGTNSVSDQFLRKPSIYAKGKLSKLDYRLALSRPMSVQTGNVNNPTALDSAMASYSAQFPKLQSHGYLKWEFWDKESNLTPYLAGNYLGKKRIFNIGAGFLYQPEAMWLRGATAQDTIYQNLSMLQVDLFYDAPLNAEKEDALTFYAAASKYNYGKNYVRMIGVMNPANSVTSLASLNGAGNAFPMVGTGMVYFAQIGYLFAKNLLPNAHRIQLYTGAQFAPFDGLEDPMLMTETGMNFYILGSQLNKISINHQSRPVYNLNASGLAVVTDRKAMWTLQFQVGI